MGAYTKDNVCATRADEITDLVHSAAGDRHDFAGCRIVFQDLDANEPAKTQQGKWCAGSIRMLDGVRSNENHKPRGPRQFCGHKVVTAFQFADQHGNLRGVSFRPGRLGQQIVNKIDASDAKQ